MDDATADDPTRATLAWLLASEEPAVRYLTRRELLGDPDGGFGVRPYSKWTGAHWRLVSLVELAAPAGEPRLQAAASTVLDWPATGTAGPCG